MITVIFDDLVFLSAYSYKAERLINRVYRMLKCSRKESAHVNGRKQIMFAYTELSYFIRLFKKSVF